MFDLSTAEDAYLFGLLQTDGTHEGSVDGKGRVSIELAVRDADILYALRAHLPCFSSVGHRARQTNFSGTTEYRSASLRFYAQPARRRLADLGLPPGAKAHTAVPPVEALSAPDYVRGLVDGDGSVGFTAKGYPFISFVTASESLARYFEAIVFEVTGARRRSNRNARDQVFNVMVANQNAVTLARWLYYPGSMALHRKAAAAAEVLEWTAPSSRYGVARKPWTPEEDAVVLSTPSNAEAATRLARTTQSVNLRRWRLSNAG